MPIKCVIFIDNGVTGSIGVYGEKTCMYMQKPVKEEQGYQKSKKTMKYPAVRTISDILASISGIYGRENIIVVSERPMINPGRFTASISGAIAYATERVVILQSELPYMYCDSGEWQKAMLPKGIKGAAELKKSSRETGLRLFPSKADVIKKQGDADGILGAMYYYNKLK